MSHKTRVEDMGYWGLSAAERAYYLGRLSVYYRRRSDAALARMERMFKWPMRISLGLMLTGAALWLVALVATLHR